MTASYHATHPEPIDPDCPQCADPLTVWPDEHPGRVFAWVAIAALGWLAAGLIVWRLVR